MRINATGRAPVDELTHWRCDQLTGSGFPPTLAEAIACDPQYDVHALIGLVKRGCRPDVAARILAPLDEADGP
jgi:hypothetical protein